MAKKQTSLTETELESRKEVAVRINLKGIADGYKKLFHDVPLNFFKKVARKAENLTRHMMTGHAAVITMPLGIVGRNGARNFHQSISEDGKYSGWGKFGGYVGAATGWGLAGMALYGKGLAITGVAATVGKVGIGIGAAVATGLVVTVPAFTVGVLAAGVLAAASTKLVSLALAAPLNIGTGWQRTKDRFRGIKHDIDTLQPELKETSLQTQYERESFRKASRAVQTLDTNGQKKIFDSLKDQFQDAQANDNTTTGQTQTATPAAKKSGPQSKK